MERSMGPYAFLIFIIPSCLCLILIYVFVPETQGLSIPQIMSKLSQSRFNGDAAAKNVTVRDADVKRCAETRDL